MADMDWKKDIGGLLQGFGQGLVANSGWSDMPRSLGDAFGYGMSGATTMQAKMQAEKEKKKQQAMIEELTRRLQAVDPYRSMRVPASSQPFGVDPSRLNMGSPVEGGPLSRLVY